MRAGCACPPFDTQTIDSKNGGHGAKSAFAHPTYPSRPVLRQREIGFDAFELGRFLLPSLKRKIEPKGEITMRKAFAIKFVTHDGDMQLPEALQ
jgi:hypothetical protein